MGFSEWKNERGVKMYKKNNKKEKTKDSYRHLSPLEKETIIVFNKGEKEASIFTYEKTNLVIFPVLITLTKFNHYLKYWLFGGIAYITSIGLFYKVGLAGQDS